MFISSARFIEKDTGTLTFWVGVGFGGYGIPPIKKSGVFYCLLNAFYADSVLPKTVTAQP